MIAGAVLCGGASSRMGTDKAFVDVAGAPMAARVAAALEAGGCSPVVFVGGDAARLTALGRPVIPDRHPGSGPAGAVLTALASLDADLVVVAACDIPFLDGAAVAAVADAVSRDATVDAAVAVADGWQQSLTCWRRAARRRLGTTWSRGGHALRDLLRDVACAEVTVRADVLRNVNTPAHRAEAQRTSGYLGAVAVPEIDVDQLADRLADGARVVDVREPDEYVEGHVPGAVLVPLATVPERIDAFVGEGPTYVICRSGARSMRACEFLVTQGIDGLEVANVAGGTMAWIASGRDVVGGDQPS